MHYLKTYFFVDLISNFPFNTCVMIYTDCCIKCYVVNVVQETVRFIRMRTVLNYMVGINYKYLLVYYYCYVYGFEKYGFLYFLDLRTSREITLIPNTSSSIYCHYNTSVYIIYVHTICSYLLNKLQNQNRFPIYAIHQVDVVSCRFN